jgi:hypothetical protein
MARWNRPLARGIDSRVATLMAPADWPKMVTLAGSPPKAPMFSCTHSSAAIWSRRPRLARPLPRFPAAHRHDPSLNAAFKPLMRWVQQDQQPIRHAQHTRSTGVPARLICGRRAAAGARPTSGRRRITDRGEAGDLRTGLVENATRLHIENCDAVIVHDPQPLPLMHNLMKETRRGFSAWARRK